MDWPGGAVLAQRVALSPALPSVTLLDAAYGNSCVRATGLTEHRHEWVSATPGATG